MNGNHRTSGNLAPLPVIHRRSSPVVKFTDPTQPPSGRTSYDKNGEQGADKEGDPNGDPNGVTDDGIISIPKRPLFVPPPKLPFNPCGCFDYSCCVDNLRRGCVAIGTYQSLMGTIGIVCLPILLATENEKIDPNEETDFESFCGQMNMAPGGPGIIMLIQYLVTFAAGIVIFIGALKRKKRLLRVHGILMMVSFVLGFIGNVWRSTTQLSLLEQMHTWSSFIYSSISIVYFGISSLYLRRLFKYKNQYPGVT